MERHREGGRQNPHDTHPGSLALEHYGEASHLQGAGKQEFHGSAVGMAARQLARATHSHADHELGVGLESSEGQQATAGTAPSFG